MVFCTIIVVIMPNRIQKINLNLPCTVPCYVIQQIFFCLSRGHTQLSKLSIRNKVVLKMVFCTIIVVIMSNPIQRITLKFPCTVLCYVIQQIPRGHIQLSKLSIRNKVVLKMLFCKFIVVIMSNPIIRITLNLPCIVPCYAIKQIFVYASP